MSIVKNILVFKYFLILIKNISGLSEKMGFLQNTRNGAKDLEIKDIYLLLYIKIFQKVLLLSLIHKYQGFQIISLDIL
jgi:hypothetical protein